jgi:hypothetical protein
MKTLTRSMLLLVVALACAIPSTALAAGVPGATTGAARDVSPSAATLPGTVRPNGLVTTWYFQYGKKKTYGTRTPAQDAGAGTKAVPVTSTITGLAPNTTYHYRLVATNSRGATQGADRTFKTPQVPTVSTIATSLNPNRFGQLVAVSGFLIGPKGGGGKEVALEGNAFPFTAGFQQIGNSVLTADNGGYQFVFPPIVTTQLRVVDRSDPSIVSPIVTQSVATLVTLKPSRRSRKGVVRFAGTIQPAGAASSVVIQKRTPKGGWKNVTVAFPKTKAGATKSTYSRRKHVRSGVFRAVALPRDGGFVEGLSKGKRVHRR